jgi:group I intron endonuclease
MKGIYKITNLINGKTYIGQTDRLNYREREHFYRLENNTHHNEHLQRAFLKYGKNNFKFEIIEETEDLDNREIFWINEHGGINSDLNYNLKDPLNKKWSEYVKIKHGKQMLGEDNPNFGRKWTQEQKDTASKKKLGISLEELLGEEKAKLAKENMRKGQLGRNHSDEVKDKIRKANEGENNPAYGKGERQVGEKNPMWGKKSKNRKKVLQFSKEGEFIKEYECLHNVVDDGFNFGNVGSVCNRKAKSAGGFIWKFKE